eukprot:5639395-Alexandrium_andersonii.AAC.1
MPPSLDAGPVGGLPPRVDNAPLGAPQMPPEGDADMGDVDVVDELGRPDAPEAPVAGTRVQRGGASSSRDGQAPPPPSA